MIVDGRTNLLILDNDGVLVDSEELDYEASRIVTQRFGLTLTRDDYVKDLMGRKSTQLESWIVERKESSRNVTALYEEILANKMSGVRSCDGALEILQQANIPWIIATSRSRSDAVRLLATCGLAGHVNYDRLVSGDDVRRSKPAPDIFLEAARRGGAKPANCVVVEDSVAGVEGASCAGMQVIGMLGLMSPTGFAKLHVPYVKSLRELSELIDVPGGC